MDKETKDRVTITVTGNTKRSIEELAQECERSFSQMAEILLREGLMRYKSVGANK